MDDFSFDPRSWRKDGRPKASASTDAPEETVPNAVDAEQESLPEAWRGIGTSFAPQPFKAVAAPVQNLMSLSFMASAVLLAAAAGAAWQTRIAPPTMPVTAARKEATTADGAVERALKLSGTSEIADALTKFGVPAADAANAAVTITALLKNPGEIRLQAMLKPSGKDYVLDRLQVSYADGSGAVLARDPAGKFAASAVTAELTSSIRFLPGEIDAESFYTSAVSAGVPDTLVPEFINAFGYDFNLASEVSPGDTFEVAFEQSVNASGEAVSQPLLLYAKLTTSEKSLALYRFKQADGTVGWFDGNGATTKRGFMRTPVDGVRITSKFGMRFHPTLHYNRLHAGVDFGVPVGTSVYAAAEGVVIGAKPTGCGGNMAVVQHDNGWVTRYFHLSRYAPELHEGQRVPQGFTLGLSGNTGSCTSGPHLHYELRIDGEPVDPMSIPTENGKRESLLDAVLATFVQQRNRIDVARAKQGI